jgi:hypothetical protein
VSGECAICGGLHDEADCPRETAATTPAPHGGRTLTSEEVSFCDSLGLEVGFDDDNPELHQFTHICWPYAAYEGSLCDTNRLWFHGGRFGSLRNPAAIDCVACLEKLQQLRGASPVLLNVIGRLAEAVETLSAVANAGDLTYERAARARDEARHARNAEAYSARHGKRSD